LSTRHIAEIHKGAMLTEESGGRTYVDEIHPVDSVVGRCGTRKEDRQDYEDQERREQIE
jgi:hypothetical protein